MLALISSVLATQPSLTVLAPPSSHRHVRLGAAELRRYLGTIQGGRPRLVEAESASEVEVLRAAGERVVTIATADDAGFLAPLGSDVIPLASSADSYVIKSGDESGAVSVVGSDPLHALYGAYSLLESMGCTFSTAGATTPLSPELHVFSPGFRRAEAPAFSTRGLQPFHDFMEGPDWWGEDELKRVTEAVLSLKGNLIGFHTYPLVEPAVWIGLNTSVLPDGNVTPASAYGTTWRNTQNGGWGYNPLATELLGYGAGSLFEHSCFGHETVSGKPRLCPQPVDSEAAAELFNEVGLFWRRTFAHAAALGVQTVLGTEMPLAMPPTPPPTTERLALQLWCGGGSSPFPARRSLAEGGGRSSSRRYSAARDDHFVTPRV